MMEVLNKNYSFVSNLASLEKVYEKDLNIVIFERKISSEIKDFLNLLLKTGFSSINKSLKVSDFEKLFDAHFKTYQTISPFGYRSLKNDIKSLIDNFSNVTNSKSIKVFFGIVDTDMCRRFHTDMYDLRMITSYIGKGTQWLTNDNVDFKAFDRLEGNEKIVLKNENIQQLAPNDVAIMKGDLFPNSSINGVIHKSPAIEKLNQKRIILRVDNSSLTDII